MVTKKRVKWNPGMKPTHKKRAPARIATTHLEPRFSSIDENDKLAEQYLAHLYVGSMWRLTHDLTTQTVWDNSVMKPVPTICEFTMLIESYNPSDSRFPKGMSAIYTGHVYVNEIANSATVRVRRPSFIIANGRFIVKDLKNMEPVE
jgi:hypothetical protein